LISAGDRSLLVSRCGRIGTGAGGDPDDEPRGDPQDEDATTTMAIVHRRRSDISTSVWQRRDAG
jgi:hypothetical protein